MRTKKGAAILTIVLVLIAVSVTVIAVAANSRSDTFFTAGTYFKDARNGGPGESEETVAAVWKDQVISMDTVEYAQKLDALRGEFALHQTDRQVVDGILRTMILRSEAEAQGLGATEEQIEQMVQDVKSTYDIPSGKEFLDSYCAGAGITLEEYYDQIRTQAPGILAEAHLRIQFEENYCREHELEYTGSRVFNDPDLEAAWEAYTDGLFQAAKPDITYYLDTPAP